ncbi:DUF2795 domain-containing protein [Nocardiopsis sp. NRRL B-16309]|uniref:DUF2795 domain-containing protein n=1 Tax=Nocardiopsis sp. NRRL B-16309 TaxID=1519494 RepID=UPI0006AF5652|nr:DUF2795 domain-containing protein [Nocardiopsis sp. NRRL B-16309]KOX14060.1 hypothetical protein ADL05_17695 [Nocardiopsis sp. NRRL B-16309]
MGVKRGVDGLRQILDAMDFPADKDTIVERALAADGDEEMLSALRSMPPADFNEPNEVLRAVPLPESEPRSHTESARARERGQEG